MMTRSIAWVASFLLAVMVGSASLPSIVLAQTSLTVCKTPPWETFGGAFGQRPYRPLVTLEPSKRIGRSPPFDGDRLDLDFTIEQSKDPIMIGDTPVVDVTVAKMLPGDKTQAYYFEPDGALCVLSRKQMQAAQFRAAFGYSGVRLQLSHDDLLATNVRSRLSFKKGDSESISRPEQAPFGGAPCQMSNLHTHGLLVSPYVSGGLLGDYVLNLARPSAETDDACANPVPELAAFTRPHAHGDMFDVLKHRIRIPHRPTQPGQADALESGKHPSGLFWFHPHPHGYSASQLTGGNSGLITVGQLADYAKNLPEHSKFNMRFFLLKDAQAAPIAGSPNFRFVASPDTGICDLSPGGKSAFWPNGQCNGKSDVRWIFTVNGVQNPHIAEDVKPGESEIWRIANGSPTVSYHLSLIPAKEAKDTPLNPDGSPRLTRKPFKVLAKDGAALPAENAMGAEEKEILLMPGARAEILIRDLGKEEWMLVTEGLQTGGDSWPRMVLATLKGHDAAPAVVRAEPYAITSAGPSTPLETARASAPPAGPLASRRACDRLAGRERLILLVKNPTFGNGDHYMNKDLFGIVAGVRNPGDRDATHAVYFERAGKDADLTKMRQAPFDKIVKLLNQGRDPQSATNFIPAFGNFPEFGDICTRLSKEGGEEWVVENWTNEIHNFHIHQTRFFVSDRSLEDKAYFSFPCERSDYPDTPEYAACRPQGSPQKTTLTGFGDQLIQQFYSGRTSMGREAATLTKAAHDSVPIPRGSAGCNGDPTNKDCLPGRVTLRVPFDRNEQIGTFVYHCHILEHEDHGMMGVVQVRAQ